MISLVRTRYGPVQAELAAAARRAIAVLAAPALLELEEVHLRLGILAASMGVAPAAQRPVQRWAEAMTALFPYRHQAPLGWQAPPPRVGRLLRIADPDHLHRLARLLLAAGTVLAVEGRTLDEQIETAARVHPGGRRPFDLVPSQARHRLMIVSGHAMRLITHAEPDKLGHLLPSSRPRILAHWCRPGPY